MMYVNRWSVSAGWITLMILAWFAFVPAVLSVSSWAVAILGGIALLVAGATFWEAGRPTPSFGQSRAQGESARPTVGRRS